VVTGNAFESRNRDNKDNRARGANNREFNKSRNFKDKSNGGGGPRKDYKPRSYGDYKDKDRDMPKAESRRSTSSKDSKAKEQQPDKFEIVKRLEKEKKAMQKKSEENSRKSKNEKPQTRQVKQKRANNIDWTKEYENDSYDDDDISYMY
jgi:hypothetical protein